MNDEKLVRLIKHNPSGGLSAAVEQYGPLVKTVVVRIVGHENQRDVEECVSDVFVELWKSIDNYNPEKGLLKNYIISIARHVGINTYRRKLNREELIPLEEDILCVDVDLTNTVSRAINKDIIKETIHSLPHPDKDIFIRRYFLFESVKEIASLLGLSPKAVENRLYRGKDKLREALLNKGIII